MDKIYDLLICLLDTISMIDKDLKIENANLTLECETLNIELNEILSKKGNIEESIKKVDNNLDLKKYEDLYYESTFNLNIIDYLEDKNKKEGITMDKFLTEEIKLSKQIESFYNECIVQAVNEEIITNTLLKIKQNSWFVNDFIVQINSQLEIDENIVKWFDIIKINDSWIKRNVNINFKIQKYWIDFVKNSWNNPIMEINNLIYFIKDKCVTPDEFKDFIKMSRLDEESIKLFFQNRK